VSGSTGEPRLALERLLRQAEDQGRVLDFWWRDDDAVDTSPALDRLLALAESHNVPLGLAVIPAAATDALGARLAREANVWVLQHGWQHKQHNRPHEKKAELGDQRPLPAILDELRAGRERLEGLFPERFLPVLVPPWNRISDAVRAARSEVRLPGLSAFGRADRGDKHQANAHLDIFHWKPTRRSLSQAEAYASLCEEVERRLSGDREPIGLLTHHLVHEEESWDLLESPGLPACRSSGRALAGSPGALRRLQILQEQ
jgi:hypothetical protein